MVDRVYGVRSSGFTLVETITIIVVLSIIFFIVLHIMIEGFRIWWTNRDLVELRSTGRYTLTRIAAEFREAVSIGENSQDMVSFNVDIDQDGDIENVKYYFYDDSQNPESDYITRVENSGRAWAICHNVKSVSFRYDNNINLLTIEIVLSSKSNELKLRSMVASRCMP